MEINLLGNDLYAIGLKPALSLQSHVVTIDLPMACGKPCPPMERALAFINRAVFGKKPLDLHLSASHLNLISDSKQS